MSVRSVGVPRTSAVVGRVLSRSSDRWDGGGRTVLAVAESSQRWGWLQGGGRPGAEVDPAVVFEERFCGLGRVGVPVALGILALAVVALANVNHQEWWVAPLVLVAYLAATVAGMGVLFGLPQVISVRDGRFLVGVRSFPSFARAGRRIAGPLGAVQRWDVLPASASRELRRVLLVGPPAPVGPRRPPAFWASIHPALRRGCRHGRDEVPVARPRGDTSS